MDARVLLLPPVRNATLRDDHLTKGEIQMAKMTKTATIAAVAEAADISKTQAKAAMDAIASLAYANANDGFVIPGIGKVSVRQTKARTMVMAFGPKKGAPVGAPCWERTG